MTVEFLLFIKSQFTTNAQNGLHLNPCTRGHLTAAPFQSSRSSCQWFDWNQKCVDEVSLHFQLEVKALGIISVPTYKYLKK